ncbi:hypothetical protein ABIB40_004185 [Pedobacter sp. UYP30]|uniref:hypothetical protein n=1 Tax=Pedobacter sp. UYP30 TaxID=1756400 RepID=UPI003393B6FA
MKYYELYPEVAGTIIDDCIVDVTTRPIKISSMCYEFDGWLGDDLITEAAHFIVTDKLADALIKSQLNGFQLDTATVSKSEHFEEIYPDRSLPVFKWLKVNGIPMKDDFWFSIENMMLNVSVDAYNVLKNFQISNCDVEEI